MASIYHNVRTQRQYKAATGLEQVEFDALLRPVPRILYAKKLLISGLAQPILTDKREALFFILHYYKVYPNLQNLSLYFGIPDAAASQYLKLLKPYLKAALQQ